MQVSIVIPVYNALRLAQACVTSIFEVGSELAFEVIVVNNGSAPDVQEWLLLEEQRRPELRHLYDPQPLGFARAVNIGAQSATGEILVVLNSDTVVSPGWLEGLRAALHADPSLGAVTPSTNQAGDPAQIDLAAIDLSCTSALALAASRPKTPDVLYLPQRLTFFCVALRREVWLELGGLDESYLVGNFEDDDLCLRLRLAGYRLAVARHIFVYHHHNASFLANGINNNEWITQNAARFAARARELAIAIDGKPGCGPKPSATQVSVVILRKDGGSPELTLRSLANQTVEGFQIVGPGSPDQPSRPWIAYLNQGDILYSFHLETLLDALQRNHADSIFSDAWIASTNEACTNVPPLAGWMHHSSLDPSRLPEQSTALHWPRLTWEMQDRPSVQQAPSELRGQGIVEAARQLYRRSISLENRLAIDTHVRRFIRRPKTASADIDKPLRDLATRLEPLLAVYAAHEKGVASSQLPAVVTFNTVPWQSIVQRPHHFSRGLAQKGHPVLWVDTNLLPPAQWRADRPCPQVAPGVFLLQLPGLTRDVYNHLPWTGEALDAMTAAVLLTAAALGFRDVVSLVHYPRWQPLVMRLRDRAGWKVVYDSLDDQVAMAEIYQTQLGKCEELLVDQADLVVTSSIVLQERMRRRSPLLLPNAADFALFSSAVPMGHLRNSPRPVIGYFGALADWLDFDLIRAAALEFPAWSFVYIGPSLFSNAASEARWLQSTGLPNITRVGQLDPRTLAAHLAEFDVCTMPFLDIPVTRTMNAVKLYEYLAAGKPAIARDLPEVRHLLNGRHDAADLITTYSTPREFFDRLRDALRANNPEQVACRKNFAQQNDWSQRVDLLSAQIVGLAHDINSSSSSSNGLKTRSHE